MENYASRQRFSSIEGTVRDELCFSGHFHILGPKYSYDVSYNCIRINSSLFFGSKHFIKYN